MGCVSSSATDERDLSPRPQPRNLNCKCAAAVMGCCGSSSATEERDLSAQTRKTEEFSGNRDVVQNTASNTKVAWPRVAEEQEQQAAELTKNSLDELQAAIEEPRKQQKYEKEREKIQREREDFQQEKQSFLDERKRNEEEVQRQQQQLVITRDELNADKDEFEVKERELQAQQQKLKDEEKRKEDEIRSQQQQLQHEREEFENDKKWLEAEKQKLQEQQNKLQEQQDKLQEQQNKLQEQQNKLKVEEKRQQRDHDTAMKKLQARYDEQVQEFKKLTSASWDSRKRNRDIRPGDITHETLSTKFQEYYDTKFRSKLRKLKYSSKEERCHFLSTVLQVACKYCNGRVMEHMTKELSTLYESPQSPRCMDPDQLLQDQSHDEKWRDRSAAFGLLLSVVDVDPKQQPAWIKIEEVQDILISESEPFKLASDSNFELAMTVLNSALEIAWIMSTLVPPSSADEPTTFYQQWHELVAISGPTVDPECDPYSLTYCRPVLFFGAEGTVGKVGSVKCFPLTNDDKDELVEKQEVQPAINQVSSGDTIPDKEQTEQEEEKFYDAQDTNTPQGSVTLHSASQLEEDSKLETHGNANDESINDTPTMAVNDTQGPVQENIGPDMTSGHLAKVNESLAELNKRKIPILDMNDKNDYVPSKQQSLNGADIQMGTERDPLKEIDEED